MSSSEWKEVKLGEVCDIGSSKRIFASEYTSDGVAFFRSKEIIEKAKGEKISTNLYISENRFYEIESQYGTPQTGDILLTSVGTLGVPYLVRDERFYFKDGNLTWFKDFNDELVSVFLYYWFLSKYGKHQIDTKSIGSTQKALTIDTLKKFDINLPPLQEQKAIANILSTLDEKIETNNKINKTLEEMAQAIFKHWFVDFEFPNEDGEPYKSSGGKMVDSELGSIPKGWEICDLKTLCDSYSGYSYKGSDLNESRNAMVTIKNFNIDGTFRTDGFKEIIISDRVKESHYCKEFDVIVAHTDLTQNADIIGNPLLVMPMDSYNKLIFSMDTVKVVPKHESYRFYVYEALKNEKFKNYALGYTTGTTVLHLSKKAIPNYLLPNPNDRLLETFDVIAKNIFMSLSNYYVETLNLMKLRDTLLPKLMSGEIRVPIDNE